LHQCAAQAPNPPSNQAHYEVSRRRHQEEIGENLNARLQPKRWICPLKRVTYLKSRDQSLEGAHAKGPKNQEKGLKKEVEHKRVTVKKGLSPTRIPLKLECSSNIANANGKRVPDRKKSSKKFQTGKLQYQRGSFRRKYGNPERPTPPPGKKIPSKRRKVRKSEKRKGAKIRVMNWVNPLRGHRLQLLL